MSSTTLLRLIASAPDTPWESHAAFVAARRRRLPPLGEGTLPMALIEVEPGGRVLPHVRSEALLYLVLTGEAMLVLNEIESALLAGDMVAAPAGAVRGLANDGAGLLRVVEIQPPAVARRGRFGLRF